MAERIGFIGLGTMGFPMMNNIAAKGYPTIVYDNNEERLEFVRRHSDHITVAGSLQELGGACDIVVTMLPTPQIVKQVVSGQEGLFAGMKPGSIWVDMSTGDPAVMRALAGEAAERHIHAVDAPVGRSSQEAENGKLIVLAGCEESVFVRVRPLLSTMASDVLYCGTVGMGQTMKLVNNHLNLTILQISLEALALGRKSGLSFDTMMNVFRHTAAWNGHLEGTIPNKVFRGDHEPGFKLWLAAKDMDLVKAMAANVNMPILFGTMTREWMAMGMAGGYGEQDHSVMAAYWERIAGISMKRDQEEQP